MHFISYMLKDKPVGYQIVLIFYIMQVVKETIQIQD